MGNDVNAGSGGPTLSPCRFRSTRSANPYGRVNHAVAPLNGPIQGPRNAPQTRSSPTWCPLHREPAIRVDGPQIVFPGDISRIPSFAKAFHETREKTNEKVNRGCDMRNTVRRRWARNRNRCHTFAGASHSRDQYPQVHVPSADQQEWPGGPYSSRKWW